MPRSDGIIRSSVLPGFQFRIQDLYDKPVTPQMVEDAVYSSFISPYLRAERERAERIQTQLEIERQRVGQIEKQLEEERRRADRYAAFLKAAGVFPPE